MKPSSPPNPNNYDVNTSEVHNDKKEDLLSLGEKADYEIEQADPSGKPMLRKGKMKASLTASRGSLKGSFAKAYEYVDTARYGTAARDEDSDEEEAKNPDLINLTPRTKNQLRLDEQAKDAVMLGPFGTGFTLFKGFVASGILYLPTNFTTGGWAFSGAMLCTALFLTLFCIKLLLDTRLALGGKMSLPEIGEACYGKPGRVLVDIALFASQFGFVCAYIYFIASQMTTIIEATWDTHVPLEYKWIYAPICFFILLPLVMVRKIQTFAKFHIFGDVMIALLVVTSLAYATKDVVDNGWKAKGLPAFNSNDWPNCIGFAVYSFEGIGVILPIQDITENKEQYFTVIVITCCLITTIYLFYAEYCLFAWYERFTPEAPLVTEYFPFNWYTDLVKILFSFQLIISYTLVIYPANMIVEGYAFKGWPKSRKR